MSGGVPEECRRELLQRLKRIEGQARGVQRMVEQGRDCREILAQLNAIRAATARASLYMVRNYAHECLRMEDRQSAASLVDELMLTLEKLPS